MEDCSEYGNPHHHPQQQQQQQQQQPQHHRHGLQQQQSHHHQKQQQQHHHHQAAKLSAALSSNALSHHQGPGQIVGSSATLTCGGRRSSYGHSHYQQQLVPQTVNFHDSLTLGDNVSISSGSIISNHSGQRYVPDLHYGTLGSRGSTLHSERYIIDDSSCIQPPSPAPSNDHYVMGMPSPSPAPPIASHNYPTSERHYTLQQRTMSPSNNPRYRHSLTENYRDISPQCERYIPPPAHFLNSTNPLGATDSYGYLNSNIHTPVKRYVPTPPPQEPTYQPQTQLMTAILTQTAATTSQQRNNHLTSTLPYRFRVKSCPNEQTISPPQGFDTSDHYATPPRVRPLKCPSSLTASCSAPSSALSSQAVNSGRQSRQSQEYLIARTPSAEFLEHPTCRVSTPVSVMSEPNGSTSCLHCNTLRRTTGVHQTTQTSGPISPQPLSMSSTTESTGRQSPMSPASISSTMAAAQSSNSLHQQSSHNLQLQTQYHQQQQQQQQQSNSMMSTAQSQPQIAPDHYSSLETRDISTIPRNHAKQQPHQQSTTNSSEQSILTNSNSRSLLIPYQQPNILSQPIATTQQQIQPPTAAQSIPPSQILPQPAPQQPQPQPPQPQIAPVAMPGPSVQPHSPPVSDSPASTLQRNAQQQILRPIGPNMSRKQRIKEYMRHETAKFFGVDNFNEEYERHKWEDRQKRFAIRRFGQLKDEYDFSYRNNNASNNTAEEHNAPQVDRPDVLPAQSQDERDTEQSRRQRSNPHYSHDNETDGVVIRTERKPSVPTVIWNGISFIVQSITRKRLRKPKQWSRSFAPAHVELTSEDNDLCDGLQPIQDEETFFDTPAAQIVPQLNQGPVIDNSRQLFVSDGDRGMGGAAGSGIINGWRTRSAELQGQAREAASNTLGQRISSHILDGVLDNSVRPISNKIKLLRPNLLDDRYDYRPFFTYWINSVQILVLVISLICYGFGPVGIGMEYKTAQVLVTSLSLQQVHHQETRNVWIGLKNIDIVHLGAKYGACMRRDSRISEVATKTRKLERETACCIRNDDSGCVQSSQADCSMRGLWPTKTIATWKKWSPGESGPGGRISGSVCGLDPKYCDAPASIAPHEWPDDITRWPICRKNNQFSQRFRFKDHTAEHMVCEVIGHPCCIGIYGECRITTREYCDFVNGYFHEEASLCSQVSCVNDVCGLFPFIASGYPDQFYRLFTSLCLHAGIIHLAITVAFQHLLMSDLERLIGPLRMAILYIGSGIAGNLTSSIFVPYKAEVGPLPALAGVLSSLMIQLILCHWKSLKKPHVAMIKLLVIGCTLFGLGTLPWQQNFTGLIAGLIFGIVITLAFVPFVNVTKHSRKSKINLIWTCMVLQFVFYVVMFILFYVFPTLFSSLNFIDGNQLADHHSAAHGYHDHYHLYEGFQNYNPGNSGGGSGHVHNHGSGGGSGTGGIINGGNHIVTTYNVNNNYKSPTGHGGGILHNHHEYSGGGGGGGGGISMSGGINRVSSSNNNNNNKNNNPMKGIGMCEKGQCVQRQPRNADTNA
ncbi:inactive rhomboid protein 1-like isoform X2 [Uranotaenia lowii]|uniref:inactive rhomboid protein 1-like isoform X2 n=1 Tax=Uranotaenia lowii TaxID=190385 RepID=UPI00247A91F1|nr:inactive rhomboid protein 1-like isoform X2 [Uranotaenia lowii]